MFVCFNVPAADRSEFIREWCGDGSGLDREWFGSGSGVARVARGECPGAEQHWKVNSSCIYKCFHEHKLNIEICLKHSICIIHSFELHVLLLTRHGSVRIGPGRPNIKSCGQAWAAAAAKAAAVETHRI